MSTDGHVENVETPVATNGGGTEEAKNDDNNSDNSTAPVNLRSTIERMQSTINKFMDDRQAAGKTDEPLPSWVLQLISELASLSNSMSRNDSSDVGSTSGSNAEQRLSYAEILTQSKSVTLTANDVKHVPRLSGSADVGSAKDIDVQAGVHEKKFPAHLCHVFLFWTPQGGGRVQDHHPPPTNAIQTPIQTDPILKPIQIEPVS